MTDYEQELDEAGMDAGLVLRVVGYMEGDIEDLRAETKAKDEQILMLRDQVHDLRNRLSTPLMIASELADRFGGGNILESAEAIDELLLSIPQVHTSGCRQQLNTTCTCWVGTVRKSFGQR